jgi:hypothetical protein
LDDTDATATPTTTGRPAAASTSSTKPDASPSVDPIIDLGERILAELEDDRTGNTLTRWLAHHVAGLVDAADRARAAGDADADARAAAARAAILELWQHHSAWPSGWPPARATAIVRLLQNLPDLEDPGWIRASALGRLQDLHHHVLALLAELVAVPGDGVEEGWLRSTGQHLTPDEVTLLTRAASAPQRLDSLLQRGEPALARLRRRLALRGSDATTGKESAPPDGEEPTTPSSQDDAPPPHPLLQLADAYRDTVDDLLHRTGPGPASGPEDAPSNEGDGDAVTGA